MPLPAVAIAYCLSKYWMRQAKMADVESKEIAATEVSVDHFFQVQIRIGRITRVEDFPKARKPAYKLWIDFGSLGTKRSSA